MNKLEKSQLDAIQEILSRAIDKLNGTTSHSPGVLALFEIVNARNLLKELTISKSNIKENKTKPYEVFDIITKASYRFKTKARAEQFIERIYSMHPNRFKRPDDRLKLREIS